MRRPGCIDYSLITARPDRPNERAEGGPAHVMVLFTGPRPNHVPHFFYPTHYTQDCTQLSAVVSGPSHFRVSEITEHKIYPQCCSAYLISHLQLIHSKFENSPCSRYRFLWASRDYLHPSSESIPSRILTHPSFPTPSACFPAALRAGIVHEALRFLVSIDGICLFVSSLFRYTALRTSGYSFVVTAHVLPV